MTERVGKTDTTLEEEPSVSSRKRNGNLQKRPRDNASKTDGVGILPSRKRQRVSQACDQCRSRKDRCDGGQPVCSTCSPLGRTCSYEPNPKKRGLPTGYVRVLEILWGLVFENIHGSEDTVLALLRSVKSLVELQGRTLITAKDGDATEHHLESWRKSAVSKEVERLLSGPDAPIEIGRRAGAHVPLDNQSDANGSPSTLPVTSMAWRTPHNLIAREDPGRRPSRGIGKYPETSEDVGPFAVPYDSASSAEQASDNHISLTLPSKSWQLLDVYFAYTQCWFPIIEKHDILRVSYSYSGRAFEIRRRAPGTGKHAALWAILAYASYQDVERKEDAFVSNDSEAIELNSRQIYSTAKRLIPTEDSLCELGHVQALLILGLVNIGTGSLTAAWLLVSHAVRIAVDLGLRLSTKDPSEPDSANKSSDRRKHIFFGCFVLETLLSARVGRLAHLRTEDVSDASPIEEDGLEEWDPWVDSSGLNANRRGQRKGRRIPAHALSTFNQLLGLMGIQNDILRQSFNDTIKEDRYYDFHISLDNWRNNLPDHCTLESPLDPTHASANIAPQLLNLHLTYLCTLVILQLRCGPVEAVRRELEKDSTGFDDDKVGEIPKLIVQYSEGICTFGLPSTFAPFLFLARRYISIIGDQTTSEPSRISQMKTDLCAATSVLDNTWSVTGATRKVSDIRTNNEHVHTSKSSGRISPKVCQTNYLRDENISVAAWNESNEFQRKQHPVSPNYHFGAASLDSMEAISSSLNEELQGQNSYANSHSTPPPYIHPVERQVEMLPPSNASMSVSGMLAGSSKNEASPRRFQSRYQSDDLYMLENGESSHPDLLIDHFPLADPIRSQPRHELKSLDCPSIFETMNADFNTEDYSTPVADMDALFDELASLDGAER
ncbi:hypothetical protein MMC24_005742 [Lignoscripta atroalba]|nr:hypothetical protein [Lignoscripta atroalba]